LGPTSVDIVNAIANSHVSLVGAQIVWSIDKERK